MHKMVVAHKVIAAHKTTGTAECLRRRPGTLPSWRGSMFTRPPIDSLVNELLALVLEQVGMP